MLETASQQAAREEREYQLELVDEMNEHIRKIRDELDDLDDGWDWGPSMSHVLQSKRSDGFSDVWRVSTGFNGEIEDSKRDELENERREKEAAEYQAQRQKICEEKASRLQTLALDVVLRCLAYRYCINIHLYSSILRFEFNQIF